MMHDSDPPLSPREKLAADRAKADVLRAEWLARDAQKGYLRGTLLPAATWTAAGTALLFFAHLWVMKPLREAKAPPAEGNAYYAASALYLKGEPERAAEILTPLLAKGSAAPAAQVLMAKIQLARGDRADALQSLKTARETSLEQREIDGWIAMLERSSSLSPDTNAPD